MNREIKFKGLVGNTWVYGYLFKQLDGEYRIFEPGRGSMIITQGSEGQFTGLKDKNGVDIYDGDIIRVSTFGFDPETFTASVIWDKIGFTLSNNRSLVYFGQSTNVCDDAVIIGNIHQNPELLQT